MEIWELEARESIRDLVAHYNHAGDRGRSAELVALFKPDGWLEVVGQARYQGRAAIVGMLETARAGAAEGPRRIQHFTATHRIHIDGPQRGRGDSYYAVVTEAGLDHWGRYRDEYERCGDRWCFASRRVRVEGAVPGGWGAQGLERLAGR